MLTIHKVSLRKVDYYLEMAREDYYLNGGEPPGQWHGKGAARLGLKGRVENDHFRNLFLGFSPDGEKALVQNAGKTRPDDYHQRCPGWDLTFSAPKSVSVLWSQSSPEVRRLIEAAHNEAVRVALSIMEEAAGITRRGSGGKIWERADFIYALFEHGTSRAQEQQIHTHAILVNSALRADGTTGAVRSNSLFEYKMAVGALYRCQFAATLERELHLGAEKVNTWFELKGVSPELMDACSTRRKQILDYCERSGVYNAKEAEKAAIETRQVKGHVARELLIPRWQEIGRQRGWGEEQARELLKGQPIQRNLDEERDRVLRAVAEDVQRSPRQLTKAELIEAAAQHAQASGLDARQVLEAVRQMMEKKQHLAHGQAKDQEATVSRAASQRHSESHAPGERRAHRDHAADDTGSKDARTAPKSASVAEPGPSEKESKAHQQEQQKSTGPAQDNSSQSAAQQQDTSRTKTTLSRKKPFAVVKLKERAYPKRFGPIKGQLDLRFFALEFRTKYVAPNAPARNPASKARLWVLRLRVNRDPYELKSGLTIFFDQKRQSAAKKIRNVVSGAFAAGAKLVLVDDQRREAWFGRISRLAKAAEPWKWLIRPKMLIGKTDSQVWRALIDDWKKHGVERPEKNLILTQTRAAAEKLNRGAQKARLKEGRITKASVTVNGTELHWNDRVRFNSGHVRHGIAIGDLGTVIKLTKQELCVELDSGKRVQVPTEGWASMTLAYALAHKDAAKADPRRAYVLYEENDSEREFSAIRKLAERARVRIYAEADAADRAFEAQARYQWTRSQAESAHFFAQSGKESNRRFHQQEEQRQEEEQEHGYSY